jgi:phytanoyl-CoA hydroxylase
MQKLEILSPRQRRQYDEDGFFVLENVLSASELDGLRRGVADLVEGARALTANTPFYDLETSHTPQQPRLRRVTQPDKVNATFGALVRHPKIVAAMRDLWGANIRWQFGKLNMKAAGYGAAVEWHQDWAFYPHTNDDLAAVGIMLDDCGQDNGPLLAVPGSHRGPTFSHHVDGRFVAAMDPRDNAAGYERAVPLLGKAGSITVHHVRAIHASAPNTSGRDRRMAFYQYRNADAWPIRGIPEGWSAYEELMLCGESTLAPRMEALPLRMPYPPAEKQGSLYENQSTMPVRYFAT